MDLQRHVRFGGAFDRRDPDPSKNYGIHCVDIAFVLQGDLGAVQFKMYTGWFLPQNADASRRMADLYPMAVDLGYHSPKPHYEDQTRISSDCEWVEGGCYYDGSTMNAEPVMARFIAEGDSGVWEELEGYYNEVFTPEPATAPA